MKKALIEFRESCAMALSAIASHKLRSGLTLLGVMIGVFSIIVVMTAMRAMKSNVERELGALGVQTFAVTRVPPAYFGGPEGFMKFLRRKEITLAQAQLFKRRATFATAVTLQTSLFAGEITSQYSKTPPNVALEGDSAGVFQTHDWEVIDGRAMLESDIDSARDVCVLNKVVAEALFPYGQPVGQRIKINAINYTVVGVFEKKGSAEGSGIAAIPITTALNRFGRWRDVNLFVRAATADAMPDAMDQSRGLLRAIRKVPPGGDDDFEVTTSDSLIQQFNQVTYAIRLGLGLVSSIALLAAGVGIMNIMLVSVTERTKEIGIRRALGATKRNIMTQFIVEAIVLCELGGILGIALGIGGANVLAVYVLKLPPAFPVDWALIGLGICSLIGITFGTYPAWKAANLDPIESLRFE